MTGRSHNANPDDEVEAAAGRWFARRRSGAMTGAEAQAMEAWLRQDSAHRAAFDRIEHVWSSIEYARRFPEILALRERGRSRRAGFSRTTVRWAAAACLAVVVLGAGGYGLSAMGMLEIRGFSDQRYATAVGEKSTFTLPDGSVVTLNTNTVLRTSAARDRRVVYLDRGQAFFRVAKNPDRPFVVHAAGRSVTALGTAFDVRVEGRRFEVTLVEGKVRVETPVPRRKAIGGAVAPTPEVRTAEMLAGDRFIASTDAQWVVASADTTTQTSWLVGRLKFEGEPMGMIAAEFGRYSDQKIVIDDPVLARRPVSGAFKANDTIAFAEALEVAGLARIETETDTMIRLVPPLK